MNTSTSKSGWKITAPKPGEPWKITKNDKTWNWYKFHKYWTTGHNSDNYRKGEAEQNGNPATNTRNTGSGPSLTLNLVSLEDDDIFMAEYNLTLEDSFDTKLDSLVMRDAPIPNPDIGMMETSTKLLI